VWQNVLDLWTIQEAIFEIKPALLVETGTNRGGSAVFYAHLFELMSHGRVITCDVEKLHASRIRASHSCTAGRRHPRWCVRWRRPPARLKVR
jgi:cephalosporin hydroxylase